MDFPFTSEEAAKKIGKIAFYNLTVRAEYIEMMSAAFLRMTDVDPRDVELVEQRFDDGLTTWHFQERPKHLRRSHASQVTDPSDS